MNKILKAILCAGLGCSMLFAAACGGDTGNSGGGNGGEGGGGGGGGTGHVISDPETRALSLSIGALDGNFNPFFSTTLTDSQVISHTQASMITTDADGKAVAGDEWPTVAKDYTTTSFDKNGNQVVNGTMDGTTRYEFLIKNGIKFSDGTPLTIKDVLFNYYVYLDPAYTGSNTMYSVDIQGLKAYRNNDATLTDDSGVDTSSVYYTRAQSRILKLIEWSNSRISDSDLGDEGTRDLARVRELFKEEAESDWNAIETSYHTVYDEEYAFTEAWQAYLFQEGLVQVQQRRLPNGTFEDILGENGKKLTTLDPWAEDAYGGQGNITDAQQYIDGVASATTADKIQEYITANGGADEGITEDYARLQLAKAYCVDRVYVTYTEQSNIDDVLMYWATGTNALTEFAADERSKAFSGSDNPIDYISGITTKKVTSFNGKELGAEHDVLCITINGIDPAAIWQFGVTIAPLNYYSTSNWGGKNYIESFNGDDPTVQNGDHCFGLERGNTTFMNQVLKNPDKSGLPKGAGPYMASTIRGGVAADGNQFERNNIVYYERNVYFTTFGDGVDNAKIKYLRYKVLDEDRILSSIESGEVDYGEPNANRTNMNYVTTHQDSFGYADYNTNGFGYVGINPKYVPDIEVRQAIMMALNTNSIITNYYGDLATLIHRPMSLTSWAYPKPQPKSYYGFDTSGDMIVQLVESAGYSKGRDNVYVNTRTGHRLKYTFTISGTSTDHPAFSMFNAAATKLNALGFEITVLNDANALKKMATGELAIWAAAWSSGIDPDMYQVYHKDSTATSVLNWGYPTILGGSAGDGYDEERVLINELSDLIKDARETTDESTRANIYSRCLDKVMELAIELPTYQRHDLCVYKSGLLDRATMTEKPSDKMGLIAEIWKLNYYTA